MGASAAHVLGLITLCAAVGAVDEAALRLCLVRFVGELVKSAHFLTPLVTRILHSA